MRNAAARSNLLVPEVREVMDIRQASDALAPLARTRSTSTLRKALFRRSSWAIGGASWRSRLDEWMDRQSDIHAADAELDPHQKTGR